MAGQADGSIIIDTELDSEGFKAGSTELLAAIKSLSEEVKNLGATLKEIFNKSLTPEVNTSGAVENVDTLETKVQELDATMKELQNTGETAAPEVNTSDAEEKIAALEAQVQELEAAMEDLQNTGNIGETATPEVNLGGTTQKASDLQRQIDAVNTSVEHLEPTFQKAMSGSESAMATFEDKASVLNDKIGELQEKLDAVANTQYPTQEYEEVTKQIEKSEQALFRLYDKQDKMSATGVKENSKQWQNLQYDIKVAEDELNRLEATKARMESSGSAFTMGVDTSQYAQLESTLESAKNRLAEMVEQAETARDSTSRFAQAGNALKAVFSKIGSVGKKAFIGCAHAIKSGISGMKRFAKSSNGATGAIGKLGKKLTGLGSMLKRMVIRKIMSGIITAVKQGFDNLAKYSSRTNADLSALKSSLTQLKNSFAAAFAPILTVVTPILTKWIDRLSTALTYVGKLFAALTGAKTFTKAVAVQEDYAASLSDTSKAAKEAQKQLAGFDELNVLSDSNANSESGSTDPSEMFEEVPIESKITDFIGSIKDAFKNEDFAGIGKIIGDSINSTVQKINDFIRWDNLGSKITSGIKGIAKIFNSLVDTINWNLIGDTVAQGFNTAINILFLILTEFDWPGLAAGLAECLNGIVTGIDWANLGTTISTGLSIAIATLRSDITTFDWASLGSGIAEGLNNIDWPGLFGDLAGGLSDTLIALLDLITGFAEKLDWAKLGRDLWYSLENIVTNVDWKGLVTKAFQCLGTIIGGCASLIAEFCKLLWDALKQGFESTKNYFDKYIEEAGGNIVQGIWNGIVDALKNVGNWIVKNIWDPFINAFKKAFGIHSPSTKMAEMGKYIVEGLLKGIKNIWNSVTDFFSSSFNKIKSTISTAWEKVKSGTTTTWNNIKSSLSTTWNNIKSTASSKWEDIKSAIKNKGWSEVGSNICNGISNGISNGWSWLKNTVSNLASNLLNSAKNALGIHSPSRLFRDQVGKYIGLGIGEGVKDSEPSIIKSVSGVADAIADEFAANSYTINPINIDGNSAIPRALDSFSDKITDSFTSMLNQLKAIAERVTFTTPGIVRGAIPYSLNSAESANSNKISSAIEASNDELSSVVIQSVTNATAAIVRAIQEYSGTTVSLDIDSITEGVIAEINRKTRMTGKSPLQI